MVSRIKLLVAIVFVAGLTAGCGAKTFSDDGVNAAALDASVDNDFSGGLCDDLSMTVPLAAADVQSVAWSFINASGVQSVLNNSGLSFSAPGSDVQALGTVKAVVSLNDGSQQIFIFQIKSKDGSSCRVAESQGASASNSSGSSSGSNGGDSSSSSNGGDSNSGSNSGGDSNSSSGSNSGGDSNSSSSGSTSGDSSASNNGGNSNGGDSSANSNGGDSNGGSTSGDPGMCPQYMLPVCDEGQYVAVKKDAGGCDVPYCTDIPAECKDGNLIRGDAKANKLIGTMCDDIVFAGRANDLIRTFLGKDMVHAGRGKDIVRTGRGKDTVFGGRGADDIKSGRGKDTVKGGKGADKIVSGKGADKVSGNRGKDQISTGKGKDVVSGGKGADVIKSGKGADKVSGGKGKDLVVANNNDKVSTGAGKDKVVLKLKEGQSAVVDGKTYKLTKDGDVKVNGKEVSSNTVKAKDGDVVKVKEVKSEPKKEEPKKDSKKK